jgi:Tfp pilus assembly protein PilN
MNFKPLRLSVVLLGDRLAIAAFSGSRLEAFTVDAESPAVALRAELDARGLPARSAFFALARSAVTVKPIDLPPVSGDVREMVGFELERHLPFAAEEASYDFVLLPGEASAERPAGGEQRVLITAADRRVVDTALRLAEEARLRPLSLTVAAHNLPTLARLPRGAHVAWVHRAAGATDLLLLAGDALMLSRNVPGTDETLIAEELRRSLLAVRWRGCDAVWVSGDAEPQAIASPLVELGAPVSEPAWTPRAQRQIDDLTGEHRGALELAVAVAAGRSVRPLELLPSTMRPRRLTRAQTLTVGMAAATAALGIVALLAPGWREQRHLNRINAEINRLDPDVKAVDRVLRDLERKRKLLATVDGVEAVGIRPLPVLRELTDILPPDAWLTTVSLDAKGVELTGAASAASALIPLLENSPRLERVEFSSPVTRGRDNREQFRIRAAWEPGGAVASTGASPTATPTPAAAQPAPGAVVPAPGAVVPAPGPGAPTGPPAAPGQPPRPAPSGPQGGVRQ